MFDKTLLMIYVLLAPIAVLEYAYWKPMAACWVAGKIENHLVAKGY